MMMVLFSHVSAACVVLPWLLLAPGGMPDDPKARALQMRDYWAVSTVGPAGLIRSPQIRDVLEVTADQAKKLDELDKAGGKALLDGLVASKTGPGEYDKKIYRRHSLEAMRVLDEGMKRVLNKSQYCKLRSIALQLEGPLGATWSEVQEALRVLPDQARELDAIQQEFRMQDRRLRDEIRDLKTEMHHISNPRRPVNRPGAAPPPPKDPENDEEAISRARQRIRKLEALRVPLRTKAEKSVRRILTPAQRSRFNKLLGEPFDFSMIDTPWSKAPPAQAASSK
jgi:hypothetical protein